MKRMFAFFPDAFVAVDEAEAESYGKVVPRDRLMLHPGVRPIAAIRQWILDHRPEECVVMCDDDLRYVYSMAHARRKFYESAGEVRRIIENAMTCAHDLGIHLFCFAVTGRPLSYEPCKPIRLVSVAMGTFGVIGRDLRFDTKLERGEDVDISLRALLKDRVIYQDQRFKFDCGGMNKGGGGCQGVRSGRKYEEDTRCLEERWGQYVGLRGKPKLSQLSGATSAVERVSICVTRRSKMACHG
jgi:hypothetical protein